MGPAGSQQGTSQQLQWWHYTNLGAYLLPLGLLVLSMIAGLFAGRLEEEIEAIPTLLTPYRVPRFSSQWFMVSVPGMLIILFEGSFAIAQALPYYRDRKVSKLVCPWYVAAQALGISAGLLFAFGQHLLSVISGAGSWLALLGAVWTILATGYVAGKTAVPRLLVRGTATLPGRLGDPEMLLLNEPRMNPVVLEHLKKDLVLGRWGLVGKPFPSAVNSTSSLTWIHWTNSFCEKYILPRVFHGPMPDVSSLEQTTKVIQGVDGNDITLYIDRPKGGAMVPGVLHIHGGAMMMMSANDLVYRRYRAKLANRGFAVVSVEFRNSSGLRGPYPYPAGLSDCMSALAWTHANREALGISKLMLLGESGGANLCLATALRAKRENRLAEFDGAFANGPSIAGPIIWGERSLSSLIECDQYFINVSNLQLVAKLYDPENKHAEDPCAWPLAAKQVDLEGLPPHVVSVQELDPLRDEGLAYFEKLQKAGVRAKLRKTPGMFHSGDMGCGDIKGAEHIWHELLEDMYAFAESL